MNNVWNLKLLFDDENDILDYRKELSIKVDNFSNKWKNREDYIEKPEILSEALEEYESLDIIGPSGGDGAGTKDSFYYWLLLQKEQNNSEIKAKYNQSIEFALKLIDKFRFFKLSICKIHHNKQKLFINHPKLHKYKHFLERLFLESSYILSEKEESVLSLKQMPSHEMWDQMVSTLLSKQKHKVLTNEGYKDKSFTEIIELFNSSDKNIRDDAAKVFNAILERYSEIAEAEINALLANKKIDDQLRGFSRPDSARHVSDDIDSRVVDSLIETVKKYYFVSHKFYEIKSKLFNVSKLDYHERNLSYGAVNKKYSFEEAIVLIKKVFSKLDSEFEIILDSFISDGRIDVYPNVGKRAGAFCTDSLKSQPIYIMLNYTGQLKDVSTIAHELGHGINFSLMKHKLNALDAGMTLATAEVASTFMEDFVFEEILKSASDEEKLSLMHESVQDSITTIIRQVACYEFEKELHKKFREKGYLSSDEIGDIFQIKMKEYMGDYIEQSSGSKNWWIHWHHIRNFFYVYSYASGLLISKFLQKKVRENPNFIKEVKEFLSAGTSVSPVELFNKLGVDMSSHHFWEKGMKEIEKEVKDLEDLAIKMGKF